MFDDADKAKAVIQLMGRSFKGNCKKKWNDAVASISGTWETTTSSSSKRRIRNTVQKYSGDMPSTSNRKRWKSG